MLMEKSEAHKLLVAHASSVFSNWTFDDIIDQIVRHASQLQTIQTIFQTNYDFWTTILFIIIFFLVPVLLRDCSLCWDHWRWYRRLHMTQPCFCSSRAGEDLGWTSGSEDDASLVCYSLCIGTCHKPRRDPAFCNLKFATKSFDFRTIDTPY